MLFTVSLFVLTEKLTKLLFLLVLSMKTKVETKVEYVLSVERKTSLNQWFQLVYVVTVTAAMIVFLTKELLSYNHQTSLLNSSTTKMISSELKKLQYLAVSN